MRAQFETNRLVTKRLVERGWMGYFALGLDFLEGSKKLRV